MKTSKFLLLLILFASFQINNLKAQACSYQINNSQQCNAVVSVVFFDNSGICTPATTYTVPANYFVIATCSGTCGPIINVSVQLLTIGGAAVSPPGPTVDINSQNSTGTTGTCFGNTGYTMQWGTANTDISY